MLHAIGSGASLSGRVLGLDVRHAGPALRLGEEGRLAGPRGRRRRPPPVTRRIAHLSDLHFCRTNPAVVEALVAELNADPPDLAAVSGDLTMRARRREYRAARAFLDRL